MVIFCFINCQTRDGETTLDVCLNQIKQNSRHYAKRQYTWFRHQMEVHWVEVDIKHFENTIEKACHMIENG